MIKGCSRAPKLRRGIVYVGAVPSSGWRDEAIVNSNLFSTHGQVLCISEVVIALLWF